ncbi:MULTISPECIES: YidB family protein [unclassified Mesorhizobium]|uniref:YidB family protein n=1 Tax=unclassified Mesorhizobium TaxID=325217 RepID=UPI001CCEEEA2|nr:MULTISPECIES: YidB family protein [unclassified Mesorhizobium]MBZ9740417.1 YidB family protein [Mesorhizobium sp. CO1-1-4]MBZ9800410.1 YidB family protein [Mesorhizobium sp. ES1-6]MBZ9993474.1 YidB family protein [Mesorhizobium sp. BH1-1-4]
MGLFDNAVPGGNITKPLMIALGALLVGKMLSGRSAEQPDQPDAAAPPVPAPTEANPGDGGLLGGLGGLLDKLKNAGHGNVADSWVGTGQNQSINANDLGNAIGPQVIREIAQRTGLDEQELLKQLSTALPGIVDKLTPNGQVPQQHQVASAFNS